MKLTIIIPTYNSASCITRCLDSIVCQTMRDFEVLVMDGVSTDNTGVLVKSYNDERIKFYSDLDKGIYDAMNKGMAKAQGEWLYFIGSDDWLLNNNVLQSVFSSEIDKYDVVYGDVESDLSDKNRGEWTLYTLEYNRCHQAIFYRKTIFDKIGNYTLKYKIGADHDLNLKWFLNPKIKNVFINQKIAHFSSGGFSKEQGDDGFFDDFYADMLKKHFWELPIAVKIKYIENAIMHTNSFAKKLFLRLLLYSVRIYKKLFYRWKLQINS